MTRHEQNVFIGDDGYDRMTGTDQDDYFDPKLGRSEVRGKGGVDTLYLDYSKVPGYGLDYATTSLTLTASGFKGFVNSPFDGNNPDFTWLYQIENIMVLLSKADDDVAIGGRSLTNQTLNIDAGEGNDRLRIGLLAAGEGSMLVLRPDGSFLSNLGTFTNFESVAAQGVDRADLFGGGALADMFLGFGGDDTVTYEYATEGVTVRLRDGEVDTGTAGVDTFYSIENLIGSAFDDVLAGRGREGPNTLSGGAGDDRLSGRSDGDLLDGGVGADVLRGGDGADVLTGGDGQDALFGGFARDLLDGGTGADRMEGGAGADTFRFGAEAVSSDRDRITDFTAADGDRIDLSAIDADAAADGDQAFAFLGSAAFTGNSGGGGELRWEAAGAGYLLVQGDLDQDGAADFSLLVRAPALAEADFIL